MHQKVGGFAARTPKQLYTTTSSTAASSPAQEKQGSAIWYTAHDAASVTIRTEFEPSIAIPVSSAPATGVGSSARSLPAGERTETHPPAPAPAKSYLAT